MDASDTPLVSSSRTDSTRVETPRSAAMRRAQLNASRNGDRLGPNGRGRQQAKRDSFHFLQRTLEARAAAAKEGPNSLSSSRES